MLDGYPLGGRMPILRSSLLELLNNHLHGRVQSFGIFSTRGSEVRLSSPSPLDLFCRFPHHVSRVETFRHQVVAHHHRQVRLAIRGRRPHEQHLLGELPFQLVRDIFYHFRGTDGKHQSEEGDPVDLLPVGDQPLLQLFRPLFHVHLNLFFHFVVIGYQPVDTLHHVRYVIEQSTNLLQRVLHGVEIRLAHLRGNRLHSTNSRRDGPLAKNSEGTDAAGGRDMGSPAQLDGSPKPYRTYILAILLAEQCHGPLRFRLFKWNMPMLLDRVILSYFSRDTPFHLPDLFLGHLLEVREVKPQQLRRHVRSLLLHVIPQHFTQRLVHQVRGRVVAFCGRSLFSIDPRDECPQGIAR